MAAAHGHENQHRTDPAGTYLDEVKVFDDVDASGLAEEVAFYSIGEPQGTIADDLTPDADGVWWWGVDPRPGDATRRGAAPFG